MAKQFKDLNSLFNYLNKSIRTSLPEVGRLVEETIKEYIMKELYQSYSPSSYTRTYEYINSLRLSKVTPSANGGYDVVLYFDTDAINPRLPDGSGRWSSHMSITSVVKDGSGNGMGDDTSEMIPTWMEFGVTGSLWDRDGIHSMWHTKTELEQNKKHIKKLIQILKSRGINATIK